MATESNSRLTDVELTAARARISAAYSTETFQRLAQTLVSQLADHLERVEAADSPVLNWNLPADNIAVAKQTLGDTETPSPDALQQRFEQLVQTALDRGHNLHHPGYIGHQVPASVPLAGLFDALGAITNQVMAIYEMGPWATAVEQALVNAWGERIGFAPGAFAGLITHGGSLANLTALLTARNVTLKRAWEQGIEQETQRPVIICHADAHYSVVRAAGILGLGTENVVRTPLDEHRRIDPRALEELIVAQQQAGRTIIAVVACSCATPIGAFDSLPQIADICRRHNVWLHVDAAHGGAVAFSSRHRHRIAGLELADSCVCDAHKTLFVPALCAFVFYRNRRHRFETFRQDAPYLFDPSAPGLAEVDSGIVTIECTKRAAAYGLWGLWSLLGSELFGDLIDVTFETARQLYETLQAAADFVPLHEPECNIVVFRYVPESMRQAPLKEIGRLNLALRRRLIEQGNFYIVQTSIDGAGALRVCVMNPLTDARRLDLLLDAIRQAADEIQKA